MPKYTLDQLARRIMAREQKRKQGNHDLILTGEGAQGKWNEQSYEYRNNWNLTEEDMDDIEEALNSNQVFETEIVKTKESTVFQVNESVKKMKHGDVSMFNHLPPFLREYYGKKSLEAFFGEAKDIPPVQDVKKKLNENTNNPAFRYMINQLIERNAVHNGTPIGEKLREYDKYMNQRMLSQTLAPINSDNAANIKGKFPGEEGEKIIAANKEKQRFLAKNMFMAQLGRVDIKEGETETSYKPYSDEVSELFSHGGRVMFTLPRGPKEKQDALFDEWKKKALDKNVLIKGRFASHDMKRRQFDNEGNMISPSKEIKYKWKDQISNYEFNKKITTYFGNYGMNIPLGGLGKKFNKYDCIDDQGTFGHMYIRAKKGDEEHSAVILVGIENAAPRMVSNIGQLHNYKAIGHDLSPFYSGRVNVGRQYDGREVDLSAFKPEELQMTLRSFDAGYRELQEKAMTDKEAEKQLKYVNEKLCGKHMSAMELASLMTELGMEKKDAIRMAEIGRSTKNANYSNNLVPINQYKVMKPENVPDRPVDEVSLSRMAEIKKMSPYVESVKRQWNAMRSHTLFHSWNTKEFLSMEKSFNIYMKAFDNVMNGKTADGKEYRSNSTVLSEQEYNKLQKLELIMVKAAQDYHLAKEKKKEGGFEKHKTGQAKDRDSMSITISSFSDMARIDKGDEWILGANENEMFINARRMLDRKNEANLEKANIRKLNKNL